MMSLCLSPLYHGSARVPCCPEKIFSILKKNVAFPGMMWYNNIGEHETPVRRGIHEEDSEDGPASCT
jgi:hypothetical protein